MEQKYAYTKILMDIYIMSQKGQKAECKFSFAFSILLNVILKLNDLWHNYKRLLKKPSEDTKNFWKSVLL